jgi:hypothetical protein
MYKATTILRGTALLYGTAQTDQAMTDNVLDSLFGPGYAILIVLVDWSLASV